MWIEEDGWIKEEKGEMAIEGSKPSGLSEYDSDHTLSAGFLLSTPWSFFVGLLFVKLALIAERVYMLGLSCVLSKLSQSSSFFFQVFASILLQNTCNFLLLNLAGKKLT
ncbi:hypothetical protein HKD37_02G004053 [Glycine soja]